MVSLRSRLDALASRHRSVAFSLAVARKFSADRAGSLAALLSYYAFFSVFPLLLALATVLGFVLHGHPGWQHAVEHSAFGQLPLVTSADQPAPLHGSAVGLVVGLVLALWGGLAVVRAAQSAFDTVYGVRPDERPSFACGLRRAVVILLVGGAAVLATSALSGAVTGAHAIGALTVGMPLRVVATAVAVAVNTVVFLVLFRWLTVREVSWRDALPGAVLAGVALQMLQLAATAIVNHGLAHATSTYGRNFGTVVVMLSWFALQAQVVLVAAEVNVVRATRAWREVPRTDAVYPSGDAIAVLRRSG